MRIGVLTFHRCINYGSYWQARALVEGLNARGHQAVLLDHQSSEVTWREWRCAFQPTLPHPTPRTDFARYAAKARRFLEAFKLLPESKPFALDNPHELERFDTVVVGSDEVWNLKHPWYGGRPLFFGEGLNAERVVSYAASFGSHDSGEGLHALYAERLRGFHAISVRDENSRRHVQQALQFDPALVLDPVLQFPDVSKVDAAASAEPYLLLYGHGFPAWYLREVRAAADARRIKLVSVGYRNPAADEQWLSAGPIEFARAVAGASGMATNFFHGCVFALLTGKPFAAVSMPYRFHKLRDLAAAVGADRHLLWEPARTGQIGDLLAAPLDPTIGRNIAALRLRSNAYLDAALA
ncbi:MAG: FIG01076348: hypothetical protein [uncultured Sphingomonas sp.]|uniref:Polysaccharide pyruvyl transferase domain-containing protein n=1 Tax=uncultured Sphingomonas sp. TaxID=158754 RepID=A0A6J4T901_9SPHN|nr:MAG: FIG01076348: hypothetical protein [uncultured Sphingomonas sp.]